MAAWTQAQLDALEDAISQGSLKVSWTAAGQTKEVTYRSLDEMMRIRDVMRKSLGKLAQGAGRIYPTVGKGTIPVSSCSADCGCLRCIQGWYL